MKTSVEVLERMGSIVVHARTRYGDNENDVDEKTIVLDETSARELCAQVSSLLERRPASPAQPERPLRWFKVWARSHERRGVVTCYARGRDAGEARRASLLGHLHEAEVTVAMMADGFEPPNGG